MKLNKIQVESQWNGKEDDLIVNIPHFPHLYSSLYNNMDRYPHPYEYYFVAIAGIITFIIKSYTLINPLSINNLYIIINGNIKGEEIGKLEQIEINIKLDSNGEPEEYIKLQDFVLHNITLMNMINNKVKIYWE